MGSSAADNVCYSYGDLFGEDVVWKPAKPVRLWFARHGQSEYNLEDRIGGDPSVTPQGQQFADALPALFGRVLQDVGEDPRFVSVWTSSLLRTIQTASKIPLPQVHLKELDEIDGGVCDGFTYAYIKKYFSYVHNSRKKDKLRYRYPNGESYIDLCKRIWPIMRQLHRQNGCQLLVAHQAVLRCFFGYLEGRQLEDITGLEVPHHIIFQFTVYPDGHIERKDFPMEIITDNPTASLDWPFDVASSRPLTYADKKRYSCTPQRPLLLKRTSSVGQGLAIGRSMSRGGELPSTASCHDDLASSAIRNLSNALHDPSEDPAILRVSSSVPRHLHMISTFGPDVKLPAVGRPPTSATTPPCEGDDGQQSILQVTSVYDSSLCTPVPASPWSTASRSIPEKCLFVAGRQSRTANSMDRTTSSQISASMLENGQDSHTIECPSCGADIPVKLPAPSQLDPMQPDHLRADVASNTEASGEGTINPPDFEAMEEQEDIIPNSPSAPWPATTDTSTPETLAQRFAQVRDRQALTVPGFVTDDPLLAQEALRRQRDDENGYHARLSLCLVLEEMARQDISDDVDTHVASWPIDFPC